jgi:hypothetical protein
MNTVSDMNPDGELGFDELNSFECRGSSNGNGYRL